MSKIDDATNPPSPLSANDILANVHNQLMTDEERKAYHAKIKGESYMRWLAFYYLGRREHSRKELKDKLLAKECDLDSVENLLDEFVVEGYQSDERMTTAMIREGIGKGHGHQRIYQDMKKRGLTTLKSAKAIDAWIQNHAELFDDLTLNDTTADENEVNALTNHEVDWLAQAVQARVRKYGDTIPTDPKQKARQMRFLQYRGYSASLCITALTYDLAKLAERDR